MYTSWNGQHTCKSIIDSNKHGKKSYEITYLLKIKSSVVIVAKALSGKTERLKTVNVNSTINAVAKRRKRKIMPNDKNNMGLILKIKKM